MEVLINAKSVQKERLVKRKVTIAVIVPKALSQMKDKLSACHVLRVTSIKNTQISVTSVPITPTAYQTQ